MFYHTVAAFSFSRRLDRVVKAVVEEQGELGWVNGNTSPSPPPLDLGSPHSLCVRFDSLPCFLISLRLIQAKKAPLETNGTPMTS